MENERKVFWEKAGEASDYNAEWKKKVLQFAKKTLERNGLSMGETILDIGSGAHPVSRFVAQKEGKVIYVDFNAPDPEQRSKESVHLKSDVHDLLDPRSVASRRGLIASARLLDVSLRDANVEQVDTVILSDILNYVPAKATLRRASTYVKKNGALIILNQPGRTFDFAKHTLDSEGVSNNENLKQFLTEELGFEALQADETKEGYLIGIYHKVAV